MTLLEILLTLCLLFILASLTWPALGRPMASQRLRDSADQIRAEWVRARVKAMSSGEVHVFHFAPEADAYSIEAYADEDDAISGTGVDPVADAVEDGEEVSGSRSLHHRLPEKVRFAAGQAAAASNAQPAGFGTPSADTRASTADRRVFFYADGTCSDAQLSLVNEYGQTIALSLRGLTGVVTVGEVRSGEARGR
jgi:Tfp pilus assembly protein FimT